MDFLNAIGPDGGPQAGSYRASSRARLDSGHDRRLRKTLIGRALRKIAGKSGNGLRPGALETLLSLAPPRGDRRGLWGARKC
jgi:hypothetical protein